MKLRRIIALALTLVLMTGMFPAQALATEETPTTEPTVQQIQETQAQETQAQETEPQETEPQETEPQETEPQETEPQETEPQETEPQETEPQETEPQETEPQETQPKETEPQETQETQPQETVPEETTPEEEVDPGFLTTQQLYDAIVQTETLRDAFNLFNNNVAAALEFTQEHVLGLEEFIHTLYGSQTQPTQDETEAYEEMVSNVDFLKQMLGMLECVCPNPEEHLVDCPKFNGVEGGEKPTWQLTYEEAPLPDDTGVKLEKKLVKDESGNEALQIEVWTEGTVTTRGTEIVMVVDQSGSMYQAVNGKDGYFNYNDFVQKANKEKGAAFPGYYVAVAENILYNSTSTYQNSPNLLDWNGVFCGRHKYAVALVRYDQGTQQWVRSNQVVIIDDDYKNLTVHPTFDRYDELTWIPIKDGKYGEPAAKYFKSLYGATVDGYMSLLDQVKGVNGCSISVVGFSSPRNYETGWKLISPTEGGNYYGGTGAYLYNENTGAIEFKNAIDLTETDYQNALMPIKDQNSLNIVTNAINSIHTNYGATCPEDGFLMANEIFRQSDEARARKEVELGEELLDPNRVVVLFTDGSPNATSDMKYGEADYNKLTEEEKQEIRDAAIKQAYITKNTYNAEVYAYGHNSIPEADDILLQRISSMHPYAMTETENQIPEGVTPGDGTPADPDTKYSGRVTSDDDLLAAFKAIGEKILTDNGSLDASSELLDTVTGYFRIGGEYNDGKIRVDEIPYKKPVGASVADFDETQARNLFNDFFVNPTPESSAFAGEGSEPEEVVVEKTGKDNLIVRVKWNTDYRQEIPGETNEDGSPLISTRKGDQVIVTNYNYSAHTVFKEVGGGDKLRLIIPIEPAPLFLGGNNVVTNSEDSGLYPGDSDIPIQKFEPPHTDVTVKKDQVIESKVEGKFGATQLEAIPYEEVLKRVFLQVEGIDQPLQMGVPNYGLDAWVTDYVFIQVQLYEALRDENGELILDEEGKAQRDESKPLNPGDYLVVDKDHAVVVDAWIWPKYDYEYLTDDAGNLVLDEEGNPMKDPNKPFLQPEVPEEMKKEPHKGQVDYLVYYPTFAFADSTMYYGEPLQKMFDSWKMDNGYMDATKYLYWYTDAEYDKLKNPTRDPNMPVTGYTRLPAETFGENIQKNDYLVSEVPTVYFAVDPIDSSVPYDQKGDNAVDTSFYSSYGHYMKKETVDLNVRVYFTNEGQRDDEPLTSNTMQNAYFLHVYCGDDSCTHEECQLQKHKSGSSEDLQTYWTEEYYLLPKYCTLTIKKTGGTPGETYVFNVKTDSPVISSNGGMVDYTTVSVTVGADGTGETSIYELPVGNYQVSEDATWSWRFKNPVYSWHYATKSGMQSTITDGQPQINEGQSFTLAPDGKDAGSEYYDSFYEDHVTVICENKDPLPQWLSDFSSVLTNIYEP